MIDIQIIKPMTAKDNIMRNYKLTAAICILLALAVAAAAAGAVHFRRVKRAAAEESSSYTLQTELNEYTSSQIAEEETASVSETAEETSSATETTLTEKITSVITTVRTTASQVAAVATSKPAEKKTAASISATTTAKTTTTTTTTTATATTTSTTAPSTSASTSAAQSSETASSAVTESSGTKKTSGNIPEHTPTQDDMKVFEYINEYRKSAGLAPYIFDNDIASLCHIRAREQMIREGHTRPNGRQGLGILEEHGLKIKSAGENLFIGSPYYEPYTCFNGWRLSPSHNALMLSTKMEYAGIGSYYDERTEKLAYILICVKYDNT